MAENKAEAVVATATAAKQNAAANLFATLSAKAEKVDPTTVLVDKATLVDVPFVIKEWAIVPSNSEQRVVKYAEVSFVRQDGSEGKFRDSSKFGVRAQLIAHIGETLESVKVNEMHTDPILAEKGLTVQTVEGTNEKTGKTYKSNIYTL